MLEIGEIVKIGEDDYEVVKGDSTQLPCINCDIKNCWKNKEYDKLKANNFALSCVDLIPDMTYFKKVELPPQVDSKSEQ